MSAQVGMVEISSEELAQMRNQLNRIEALITEPKKTPAIMMADEAMR